MNPTLTLKWIERDHPHEFRLPAEGSTTLGRHMCDITFARQTISRRHAVIVSAGGEHRIENLSEVNPVIINGEVRLGYGERAPIGPGDRIRLGPVQLLVDEDAAKRVRFALRCTNCGNVNDYNPEEQCRFCGRNLANGITIMLEDEES